MTYLAFQGVLLPLGVVEAGEGTIFLGSENSDGQLIVEGEDEFIFAGGTPIRGVGRHLIDNIEQLNADTWKITVLPLTFTRWGIPDNGEGLVGQSLVLDAHDPAAAIYEISDNDGNSVTIKTTDNLSSYVGRELIGVHQFDNIRIVNASVDFGEDRVIINDIGASVIHNAIVSFGEVDQNIMDYLLDNLTSGSVEFRHYSSPLPFLNISSGGGYLFDNLDIDQELILSNGSSLSIENDLSVGGVISVGGAGTVLSVGRLSGSSLLIDGATLLVDDLIMSGNIDVINGGRIITRSVSAISTSPSFIDTATMDISADGMIFIDDSSLISADGKGFDGTTGLVFGRSSNSSISCHAGISGWGDFRDSNCVYGKYETPYYPGSGRADTRGGGALSITANAVVLNGMITANGLSTDQTSSIRGSSGGSLRLSTSTLSGDGTLSASGGDSGSSASRYAGAGGRIFITVADDQQFVGQILAAGGKSTGGNGGGAGTIYKINSLDDTRHLTIDNDHQEVKTQSTPIRGIGRYDVQSVDNLGGGQWQVSRDLPTSNVSDFTMSDEISSDTVARYYFSVDQSRSVRIRVANTNFRPHLYLFRDDGVLSTGDRITSSSRISGSTTITRTLQPGNYMALVGGYFMSTSTAISRQQHPINLGGTQFFNITIENVILPEDNWRSSPGFGNDGFVGRLVDLDADDPNNPLYTVESNTENTLIIHTQDDLSQYVGKTMVGVHMFDTLNVINGASVDFGDDHIFIENEADSNVPGANAEIFYGNQSSVPVP